MDSLMKRIERDGYDVARRFQIARERTEDLGYLRGEMAGLARTTWYVTGEDIEAVEERWLNASFREAYIAVAAMREP